MTGIDPPLYRGLSDLLNQVHRNPVHPDPRMPALMDACETTSGDGGTLVRGQRAVKIVERFYVPLIPRLESQSGASAYLDTGLKGMLEVAHQYTRPAADRIGGELGRRMKQVARRFANSRIAVSDDDLQRFHRATVSGYLLILSGWSNDQAIESSEVRKLEQIIQKREHQ